MPLQLPFLLKAMLSHHLLWPLPSVRSHAPEQVGLVQVLGIVWDMGCDGLAAVRTQDGFLHPAFVSIRNSYPLPIHMPLQV